jgi:hypothetical protein
MAEQGRALLPGRRRRRSVPNRCCVMFADEAALNGDDTNILDAQPREWGVGGRRSVHAAVVPVTEFRTRIARDQWNCFH